MDKVEQVIACVVEDHANGGQRDDAGAKLETHLDQWAVLVEVFERIECYVFVLLRLVHIFFIHGIFIGVSLIQTLVSHVFQLSSHW